MYPETGTGDFRGSQQLVASNFGHNSQVMLDRGCWGASADAIARATSQPTGMEAIATSQASKSRAKSY